MSEFLIGSSGAVLLAVAYCLGFRDGREQEQALRNIDRLCDLASTAPTPKSVVQDV